MGNKTEVLQKVYDRVSRLTDYGVKEVRIGLVDTTKKHNDLPAIWVGLESGREAANFKNAASVDNMRISINILDNKLKTTNSTLFRTAMDGGGDTYTVSDEFEPALGLNYDSGVWYDFGGVDFHRYRNMFLSGVGGNAKLITSGGGGGWGSMALSISGGTPLYVEPPALGEEIEFVFSNLATRTLTVGGATFNAIFFRSEGQIDTNLTGFSYNGISISAPTYYSHSQAQSLLVRAHTLTITDAFGAQKEQFTFYTYNPNPAPAVGGSVKLGNETTGALVLLEKVLDELDLNDSGGRDITFDGKVNNRRDIEYRIDESGDHVFIQAIIDLESAIFINGDRRGDV
jgi:hypothetical protein